MDIIVSHLPYLGYSIINMKDLPKQYGIEIFAEYGNNYYWKYHLAELMNGRTGKLSVHGPFCQINLASKECNWNDVLETYKLSYDICNQYNAVHCVCHPHGPMPDYEGFVLEDGQKLALERVVILNEIAKSEGVELLVENMPFPELVFQQDDFVKYFASVEDINFLIDIGHAMLHGWDISKLLSDLGTRIRAYHVHENFGDADSHLKVGEGPLDWNQFFLDYKQNSPNARLVLEYMYGPMDSIIE
ncbi:MAG TPA: sugar phosphate isomerase/epimerase, partial [Fibrobacteraceae bacterium]|nr:sugar phosphate isomerase/epimerase [Fibrobacteraceae bacterium]